MPKKLVVGVAAVAVAVAAIGVALQAGRRSVDPPGTTTTTGPATSSSVPTAAAGFVEVRDETNGFAVSYPGPWQRVDSPDPSVPLIVSEKPPVENQGGSVLVRVIPIQVTIGPEQLAEARQITDAVVTSGQGVELKAEPTQITQAGLPGYYYLYTFTDPASGQRGAHAHYFLFKDQNMITFVFQALPENDFGRLAPIFDQVMASFRVL